MKARTLILFVRSSMLAAALAAAPAAAQQPVDTLRLERAGLTDAELALWRDPVFQKRFTESYLAETDIEPRVTEEERGVMQQILQRISSDDLGSAAGMIEKELERNPAASAVFDFTLANIHFQRDELDPALAAYRKAVEKYPKFRRAWKNMGIIHMRQGAFAEAVGPLTRSLELGDHNAVTYGLLGFAHSSNEDFLAAESAYRMAILLDNETVDWKLGLARAFFKQERFAEAITLTTNLLAKDPERADLWMLQANAYIGMDKPMEAAEIYEIVDLMGGSTVDSLNILGDIYVNQELYSLASATYVKAMEKDPAAPPARALRAARVLSARGALEETKTLVERIEALHGGRLDDATRKDLLKLRARLAVAEGAGEDEARILREIVEIDPLDGEALILLGQHSNRNGDTEQAVFYYERAAAIEAFEADAKVRHAQVLVSLGRYNEALPLLRRAQQVNYRESIQEYLEQVERVAKGR